MDGVGPTQALPTDDITPGMYFTKSVLQSSIIAVHACSNGENIDSWLMACFSVNYF